MRFSPKKCSERYETSSIQLSCQRCLILANKVFVDSEDNRAFDYDDFGETMQCSIVRLSGHGCNIRIVVLKCVIKPIKQSKRK